MQRESDQRRFARRRRHPTAGVLRHIVGLAALAGAAGGCHVRAPIEAPRGTNAFAGADLIRVSLTSGQRRTVWYPTLSGDTAIVGLTDKIVVASTPSIQIPLRDVRTVERVTLSQSRSIALMILIGAASAVLLVIGLAASGHLPVD